jgi:hypothetical protein
MRRLEEGKARIKRRITNEFGMTSVLSSSDGTYISKIVKNSRYLLNNSVDMKD